MLTTIGLGLYGFLWGIRRGASSCMALCIPALIPTLIKEKGGWKKGFSVALWFNAPRILILTLLGVGIGLGGYALGSSLDEFTVGSSIWAIGYIVVGCMFVAYGTFIFTTISERLDDIAEGKIKEDCTERAAHPLFSKIKFATPKNRSGLFLWGGIFSIACVGETVLAIESLIGIYGGFESTSPAAAAIAGGFIFFLFSIGTAVPSLLIASFGTSLADKEKRIERLLQIERFSGVLMMVFGVIFIFSGFVFI